MVYLIANLMLAAAWKMLLNWFGEVRLSFVNSIGTYGQSQILKYIPGNILSLPGRHVLGIQQGMDHAPLIGAATFEIVGMLTTSSIISIWGILLNKGNNSFPPLFSALVVLLIALASPLVLKYVFSHEFVLKKLPVLRMTNWGNYTHLMGIWSLYLCFFALAGFILFWTVGITQGSGDLVPLPVMLSIFAVSWLLGFITPGAPAGAGVRESIMILALSHYLGESTSIVIALLMRIITTMGDVLFYFCGLLLSRKIFLRSSAIQ